MILGAHNSWTFMKPKHLWMRLIAFTAKCQNENILSQYTNYNIRCFDLRVRFNKIGILKVVHGMVEYDYTYQQLVADLRFLSKQKDKVYVRILLDVRSARKYTMDQMLYFKSFCKQMEIGFPKIAFFGGTNLYDGRANYNFKVEPSLDDKYASVALPKLLDDWWPWLYARRKNKENLAAGTDKDILLFDFVEIR